MSGLLQAEGLAPRWSGAHDVICLPAGLPGIRELQAFHAGIELGTHVWGLAKYGGPTPHPQGLWCSGGLLVILGAVDVVSCASGQPGDEGKM